jgi:hypothetical protein
MAKTIKSAIYIFLFSFLYAILRYHIFKGVPWVQLPIFILNKVFALSSFILFSLSFSVCPLQKLGWMNLYKTEECKYLGWSGMTFLFIHVIMSLLILNSEYFEKFYESGKSLNLVGNLSLLLGIIGLTFILLYHSRYRYPHDKQAVSFFQTDGFIILGLLTMCGHVLVMGINNWVTPLEWPGYMPPISLISFLILFSTLLLNIIVIRK